MKHEIELKPFRVPNFVLPVPRAAKRQDGWQEAVGIPLSELSEETLLAMCEEFKQGVFAKAGKTIPEQEKG